MATETIQDYIVRLVADTSDSKKFTKATEEMEKKLRSFGIITEKSSKLLGFKLAKSAKAGSEGMITFSGSVKDATGKVGNFSYVLDENEKAIVRKTASISNLNTRTLTFGKSLANIAKRALLTIPVWLALRSAFMGVLRTIGEGARYFVDLQSQLARAQAVTTTTTVSMGKAMDILRARAEQFAIQNKGTAKDVIEAYYRMATSGLEFKDAIEASVPATKLAIATYGDVATVAKSVSAMYRLLGDSIEGTTTREEKIKKITDILATAWTDNEIEINELSQALANFGAQAKRFNLTFTETIALLATSHQGLIKSGRAGRLLSRVLDDLSQHLDEVGQFLDVTFDPAEPLNWYKVLVQIIEKFREMGRATPQIVESMAEMFGIRSRRELGILIELFDDLQKNVDNFNNSSANMVDKLIEIRNNTPEAQLENVRENLVKLVADFITGATNSEDFVEALKKVNNTLETMTYYVTAAGASISQLIKNISALPKVLQALETPAGKKSFFNLPELSESTLHHISRLLEGGASFQDVWNEFLSEFEMPGEDVDRALDVVDKDMKSIGDAVQEALEKLRKRLEVEHKETAEQLEKEKEKLKKELEARTDTTIIFDVDVERKLKGVKELAKLNEMQAKGASETALAYEKINDWINKYSDENQLNLTTSQKLNVLLNIRQENWKEIVNQLRLSKEQQKDLINLAKILNDLEKERLSLISKIRSTFETGLSDIIIGDIDFKDFGTRLSETISRAYADAFSQAATAKIFEITGFDEAFANMGVNIRHMFEGPVGKIKDAGDYSADVIGNKMKEMADYHASVLGIGIEEAEQKKEGGLADFLSGGPGKIFDIFKGVMPKKDTARPGVGPVAGTMFPELQPGSGIKSALGFLPQMKAKGGFLDSLSGIGDKLKGAFSGFQNFLKKPRLEGKFGGALGEGGLMSRGMGAMQLGQLYKLKGTGNVFGGAAQGAMAGAQLGGSVGAVLGGLYGAFRGGQSKTTSETRSQTVQITSKIDVTNKSLEVVNRNLVALRTTMETYILPTSAYFAEKTNIEDNFSLSARRG